MRAAVIGRGCVTPVGLDVDTTFEGLVAGRSGINPITRFDASRYPVTFAAEVPLPGDGPELYAELVDWSLDEALEAVDLSRVDPARIGVFVGAEAVRPDLAGLAAALQAGGAPDPDEVAAHLPSAPTLRAAHRLGATGPVATLSTACTSSGQAVGEALLALRRGDCDVALAGGVDVLVHPLMITGFSRLGALSTRNDDPRGASRPFDLDRDGFVLGEGAGFMVLARPEIADSLGAIHGWLSGYGCSCNAWRITDSPPDGRGAASAMIDALRDAGRSPRDVAWVCAHGTGTQQNDVSEARGIRTALGDQADVVPVSSVKSMMGHLVAACGVVEAIVALEAIRNRIAPPTTNLDVPDPDCAVRHVPWVPVGLEAGIALSNAFGFGGSNATVVLEGP